MTTIEPSQDAWRELPEDIRTQVRVNYPPKPIEAAHARALVAYARHRLQVLQPVLAGAVVAFALLAAWLLFALKYPGTWAPFGRDSTVHPLIGVVSVIALGVVVLAVAVAAFARIEADRLGAAVADVPDATPTPVVLGWRFGRAQRAINAAAVAVVAILYFWGLFALTDAPTRVVNTIWIVLAAAWFIYRWPWPVASSYPYLATLDDQGIHVHPLGLTVPWHRVTRVDFVPGPGGAGLSWRLEDPAAVAASAPVSPAQQRRLLRWLLAHGGAIRLTGSQLRDRPEVAYLTTVRFRTFRVSAYSGLPPAAAS